MYDLTGWEALIDRLRARRATIDEAADYVVLIERGARGEEQVDRVEVLDPSADGANAFLPSRASQVDDIVERLRELAIDHAMPNATTAFRLSVYSPKGDARLFSGGFAVQKFDRAIGDAREWGVSDAREAAQVGTINEMTQLMRETTHFLRDGMRLVMVGLRDVQQLQGVTVRALQDRLAKVEGNYHRLIDDQAKERQRVADDQARKERIAASKAMFDTFMGGVEKLGQAYLVSEHPELADLAGLDPELVKLAKGLPPDMLEKLKHPTLQALLKDEDFRRDFTAMLEHMVAAAEQTPDEPPPAPAGP